MLFDDSFCLFGEKRFTWFGKGRLDECLLNKNLLGSYDDS